MYYPSSLVLIFVFLHVEKCVKHQCVYLILNLCFTAKGNWQTTESHAHVMPTVGGSQGHNSFGCAQLEGRLSCKFSLSMYLPSSSLGWSWPPLQSSESLVIESGAKNMIQHSSLRNCVDTVAPWRCQEQFHPKPTFPLHWHASRKWIIYWREGQSYIFPLGPGRSFGWVTQTDSLSKWRSLSVFTC